MREETRLYVEKVLPDYALVAQAIAAHDGLQHPIMAASRHVDVDGADVVLGNKMVRFGGRFEFRAGDSSPTRSWLLDAQSSDTSRTVADFMAHGSMFDWPVCEILKISIFVPTSKL